MNKLLNEVRRCDLCASNLPLGPRPILQASARAKILIAGQAPGKKVHLSGIPFDDPSGKRLRDWMGIDSSRFYDSTQVAILPMGFCYPGTGKSGDLPPRPECAPQWRPALLEAMPEIELILVLGQYAQAYHFGETKNLTQRVRDWRKHWPEMVPLPHPSPRNNRWFKQNPWFEAEVVPALRTRIAELLQD